MRAIWKGFISFGLVTIPVSVGLAQQRKDVSFRTLSRETMTPVKQKRWDPVRDEEVTPEETVKGYEIQKGVFVPVEDEELERFAAHQERTIQILEFVELAEVDPVYFERAYWLEPQERADRPYALLVEAMERSGRAAVGRFVLSTREHLVLLRAAEGALVLETLFYPEDIRISERRQISERVSGVQVNEDELSIADQLIASLSKPFDPERYPNETRHALLEFLQAKAAGQEPVAPEAEPEAAPVVDLMAALKASLAAAGGDGGEDAGEDKPKRERSSKSKDQLSIDQAKLRGVRGGRTGEEAGSAEDEKQEQEAAPRQRRRKAS